MSGLHLTRWTTLAALAALAAIMGCGTDPTGAGPSGGGGSGGSASASPGMSGIAAGSAGMATGGSVTSTAGQAGAGGTMSPAGGGANVAGGGTGGVGGSTAGAGGSTAGAGGTGQGGADPEGWVNIFDGTTLKGWVPLIHKSAFNEDPYETFRADPVNHVIRIAYDKYPNNQDFDERCGLLYYDKLLKNYRVRVTYHFLEPQAKNPVGWGKNNTGLMIFGIDPRTVTGDPQFPPLIEIQLLGSPSSGGSTNPNICTPGGMTYSKAADCGNNQGPAAPPAAQWVTVEAEVHVGGDTKVFEYTKPSGEGGQPKATPTEVVTGVVYKNQPVTGGYLSLQSESQPVEFKDVQLMELPP